MIFRNIVLALFTFAMALPLLADDVANERDHVIVTLNDGTSVEGYIRQYWLDRKSVV